MSLSNWYSASFQLDGDERDLTVNKASPVFGDSVRIGLGKVAVYLSRQQLKKLEEAVLEYKRVSEFIPENVESNDRPQDAAS